MNTVIASIVITLSLCAVKMPHAMDAITAAQVIRDGDTIVSPGGSFKMGFFSPGNSKNRYVGIWYNKVSVLTAVWVANRETPLTNTLGILKFIKPGILAILNESNAVIWSANALSSVKTPIAQLQDSGNLVIKDANGTLVWQSFDHPTDTLLPGMKLGWNYTTHLEFYLSSWRSFDDPASGDFTYHCDPTGYPQNVLRKGEVKRYSTGPWNGLTFSGLPGLRKNPVFRFGLVMNKNEVYYHYELLNNSIISRFTLSQGGVGQRWTWNDPTQSWLVYLTAPTDNCDFYDLCGSYGVCSTSVCGCLNRFVPKDAESWERGSWSAGCVRRAPLNCRNDVFLKYSGIKLPDTEHSWYNQSKSLEECRELCSKNCSCTAYTNVDVNAGGHTCLLWFGDLVDIKSLSGNGQYIYIRMASSELDSGGSRRKVLTVVLTLVTALVLLSLSLFLYSQRRKKIDISLRKEGSVAGSLRREDVKDCDTENHSKDLELPLFELSKISKATENFSLKCKIGEGGFGPVYKGQLEEGQEIAVKRLSRTSLQGVNEFKNEVICVAKLQHRNLVKLLGCCISGEEYLLIYEYMPNRSLDLILFDPSKSKLLDWPKRLHIINGIARGLLYLHQDSRLRIIHRDLKASNILLDSDMNPKISDFGLARSFGGNETGANTSRVVGTYGYMSPEYALDGLFSVKSDVFSFGVLVLEIVSGKRNRGFSRRDHYHNLLGHAWMLHKEGKASELIESYPVKAEYISQVMRAIHIGLLCVQQSPQDRPTMSSVVLMVGNEGELPQPKKPGFFTERDVTDTDTSISTSNAPYSTNEMSITLLEAR